MRRVRGCAPAACPTRAAGFAGPVRAWFRGDRGTGEPRRGRGHRRACRPPRPRPGARACRPHPRRPRAPRRSRQRHLGRRAARRMGASPCRQLPFVAVLRPAQGRGEPDGLGAREGAGQAPGDRGVADARLAAPGDDARPLRRHRGKLARRHRRALARLQALAQRASIAVPRAGALR